MKLGYRKKTVDANKKADGRKLGVQVGRACIQFEISVVKASKLFGLSRQGLYNWFAGVNEVPKPRQERVKAILARIEDWIS